MLQPNKCSVDPNLQNVRPSAWSLKNARKDQPPAFVHEVINFPNVEGYSTSPVLGALLQQNPPFPLRVGGQGAATPSRALSGHAQQFPCPNDSPPPPPGGSSGKIAKRYSRNHSQMWRFSGWLQVQLIVFFGTSEVTESSRLQRCFFCMLTVV